MIPFGIDLNTIPREEPKSKAIIPIEEHVPLAIIPPQPHCYGQSYFAQPIRTKPLLLEGSPSKGPIIALPREPTSCHRSVTRSYWEWRPTRRGRSSVLNTPLVNVPTFRGFVLIHRRSNSSPKGSSKVCHGHSRDSMEAPQDDGLLGEGVSWAAHHNSLSWSLSTCPK